MPLTKTKTKTMTRTIPLLLLAAALAGCMSQGGTVAKTMPGAVAQLNPTQGNQAKGTVWFAQDGLRVNVRVQVSGLTPNQEHGFHVHEKGDCSAPDAMSAGGHFNPGGKPHGPQSAAHHGGDMPSLKADAAGNAQASFQIEGVSVGTGIDGLLGKGVIVHAKPDDYTTQPTGNSGGRIACGVIVAS
ncbi:MAG TPA: superoxide dismutase family protein [Burkholderiaceae bacterium]|nr:superoxide dismutase family protein [Burkholderiaceae bacterium]